MRGRTAGPTHHLPQMPRYLITYKYYLYDKGRPAHSDGVCIPSVNSPDIKYLWVCRSTAVTGAHF